MRRHLKSMTPKQIEAAEQRLYACHDVTKPEYWRRTKTGICCIYCNMPIEQARKEQNHESR